MKLKYRRKKKATTSMTPPRLSSESPLPTMVTYSPPNLSGLVKGLNEVCKALDRKEALLCVLAENCADAKYKKLITALCKSNNIPLIEVEKREDLGEWLGQCKYDKSGTARKVRGASSVAVKDYGEESEALNFVLNYIKGN